MTSFKSKLGISVLSGAVALFSALPQTNRAVGKILNVKVENETGCINSLGVFLRSNVFFLISILTMIATPGNFKSKVKFSTYGSLLFYYLFSSSFIATSDVVLSKFVKIRCDGGCLNMNGILVMSLIYFILILGYVELDDEEK